MPQVTGLQPLSSQESLIPNPMSADSAFNTDVGFWLLKLQVLQEDHVLPQRQPEQEASHTACSTRLAKPCPPTGELSLGGGSGITGGAVPVAMGDHG